MKTSLKIISFSNQAKQALTPLKLVITEDADESRFYIGAVRGVIREHRPFYSHPKNKKEARQYVEWFNQVLDSPLAKALE